MTNNTNAPTEWVTVQRVAEGYQLIAVNAAFGDLMYWLDRCESKGHLENCSDLIEPFAAFDWRPVEAAPPAPEAGLSEEERTHLEQAAQYLNEFSEWRQSIGYGESAEGASCSSYVLRRLLARCVAMPAPEAGARRPLTDEQIKDGWDELLRSPRAPLSLFKHGVRWAELTHGIGGPAQVEQHRQGCDALGGYGNGVGPCSCGAPPAGTGEAK